MEFIYNTTGTCSKQIVYDIEDNIIKSVKIIGGCHGNTVGVAKLCEGKSIDEVIDLLLGTPCGFRGTSCPDQLAKGLIEFKEKGAK